jgi:hypothetical protein
MRIAACLLIAACLAGCSAKDRVPSDIIPPDQMSSVLWDMMLADQYSDAYLVKDSAHLNVKTETLKLYQQVFQLHKISLDEFRKSFHFYLDHPDMSRGLFDTVLNRGNRQRDTALRNQKKTELVPPAHGQGANIPPARPGISPARPGIPIIYPNLSPHGAGAPGLRKTPSKSLPAPR